MISTLLNELEVALKEADLWSSEHPSDQALSSQAPFCYDTLPFEGWLQFVFIVRLRAMLAAGQTLPKGAQIAPMAEHTLAHHQTVVAIIYKLDKALNT